MDAIRGSAEATDALRRSITAHDVLQALSSKDRAHITQVLLLPADAAGFYIDWYELFPLRRAAPRLLCVVRGSKRVFVVGVEQGRRGRCDESFLFVCWHCDM